LELDGAADLPAVCVWLKSDRKDAGFHFERSRNLGTATAAGIESRDCNASVRVRFTKIHGSREPFEVPPNEESLGRRQVLSKIVERCFQLWRPVGEQDHLCFFREPNEANRTRQSPHHRTDSIAGTRQCRSTGSAQELQKSSPVHEHL
jgi:hypothetical protein